MKKNGTRAHLVYLIDQYFFEFGAKIIRFWFSPLLGINIIEKIIFGSAKVPFLFRREGGKKSNFNFSTPLTFHTISFEYLI